MGKSLKDFVDAALGHDWVAREALGSDYTILDVREPDEHAGGHLPGAINIPRGFLDVKADLEHDKRDPRFGNRGLKLVCYCGGGHWCALAAETLGQMGFANPLSVRGGWTLWAERGFPIES